ncbi:DeoR/GlpR family transcriptional regulator of sugar metabolism [Paenibacillus forsythiae]|uniref:DeoR/GlpR family transcriptional regulator of sugar metabolism n=1 Tax=Paenibacillus forsythiae TaxID=365616 RepID=A0ABU3HA38_9BACL|nr:DeoR/GlpR family DNA-binding transcription regulator [Paenibacillus forsythiae]MDT3427580.1 DeoR/GlpR family transcriptional regulator of sugar metabolism [Paenibacillus forsythiae]
MLAAERRTKIINMLLEQGYVLVTELSKSLNVSEETIRRDLGKLEKENLLTRTHGGAFIDEGITSDIPVGIRERAYLQGKDWIGEKVVDLINSGDTLMLDSSTTSLHIARKIKSKKNLTVITNSFKAQMELSSAEDIKIISTGGILRQHSLSYVGHAATRALSNYFADTAIISCSGIHPDKGISDSNEYEAEMRKIMLKNAEYKILAVDTTKLNKLGFMFIADFTAINKVVVDKKLPADWVQLFERLNIEYDDRELPPDGWETAQ